MEKKKAVNVILQERDLQILDFLAKFGVASDKHLMRLVGIREEAISNYIRIIRKLKLANYVEKQRLFAGEYGYVMLGTKGAELLATTRVKQLMLNTLRHDMLVLDIYFHLQEQNPLPVMSERELRISSGLKVGDKKKVPDLLIDEKIAIEVELTEKSNARLIEIINNYVQDTKLESVQYFVRSKALGNKILDLAGHHPKFKVFLLDMESKEIKYVQLGTDLLKDAPMKSSGDFDLAGYLKS